MKPSNRHSSAASGLRRRAEERLKTRKAREPASTGDSNPRRLIHELEVHQVELEMQNEELRQAQEELEAVRARYFDLYNLAPVGYFVVSGDGRILEVNLTGADLLGFPRAALVSQPVTRFISSEDQDVYFQHRRQLLATDEAHTCELRMVKADGTTFWARLTATTAREASTGSERGAAGQPTSRVVLSDISEKKQADQDKAALEAQLRQTRKRPVDGRKPRQGKGRKGAAAK